MKKRKPILALGLIFSSLLLIVILAVNGSVSARNQETAVSGKEQNSGANQAEPVDTISNYDATGNFKYLSGPNAGTPQAIALDFVQSHARALGLTPADVTNVAVSNEYVSAHTGVTHIYLQQQHQGLNVYNAILNVNVAADGSVINVGSRFAADLANSVNREQPALSAEDAVAAAARQLDLTLSEDLTVERTVGGVAQAVVFSDGGISQNSIPVGLVYQPVKDGLVRLAWNVEIYELSSLHSWSVNIDAVTGDMIGQVDYVDSDNWLSEKSEDAASVSAQTAGPNLAPDDYVVFAMPTESPNHGSRTTETDPANATASPFGWHDTNGVAGAEFNTTQGNNAHAYTDTNADNAPDSGSSPDGGGSLVFNFPLDLATQQPAEYKDAAVTNLFYWNNIIHDVTYLYGFDEAAGNFQETNYGPDGADSDYVYAEAQDGSGTNNANFNTPSDGQNPRMQMYVWTNPFGQLVTVNTPAGIAGDYDANPSNNGGTADGLTADVAVVDDGVAPAADACETVNNDLTNKIALIIWNEGACNSSVFVQNAADAGAVAAIIVDNTAEPLTNFGGSPDIPSVAVGQAIGLAMAEAILVDGDTVNVTIGDNPVIQPDRDSDLDNGIITHEYGHGISNRLTGGGSQVGCLNNAEQMGEGWSDLLALILTADAGDSSTTLRGMATYVNFEPTDGNGIRAYPYTTDMGVNPDTYDSIIDNGTSPHSLGWVWAAMYWEVYWNLVDDYGFNADIYGDWTTGGNNLALQLLLDGMKLQPCSPGMVDGRDAILAADMTLTGGANQCAIWEGFAKRGLGYSADQGSSADRTDGTQAFDLPLACTFMTVDPISQDVCSGDTVEYNIAVSDMFTDPPVTLSSNDDPPNSTVTFNPNPLQTVPMSSTMTVDTSASTPAGTYTITVEATDGISVGTAIASLTVFTTTPDAPMLMSPADGSVDQIFQPHFEWSAVPGATEYTIEIAADAGFTNIVESATVTGTSYDLTAVLMEGTTYYWRVLPANICGATDTDPASFTTVDAACDIGTATAYYSEDFDSGAPGWTHLAPTPPDTWGLTEANSSPGSGGFAYYSEDIGAPAEQVLVSPPIDLPSGEAQYTLQFLNEQNFEDPSGSGGCWDGGLLEITTNDGTSWTQLHSESDPYDGIGDNGPPAGLNLWCGQVQGEQPWLKSIVNLDDYAGETVQFRFRNLSDAGAGAEGWYIDDFEVSACNVEAPVMSVQPESMTQDLAMDSVVTRTLSISNLGDAPLEWTIDEASTNVVLDTVDNAEPAASSGSLPASTLSAAQPHSVGMQGPLTAEQMAVNADGVSLVLDDGSIENALGLNSGGQFVWLNRFTPIGDFPFQLEEVHILFGDNNGVDIGELVDIYVYEDTDGDNNPATNATHLGTINNAAVQATDDTTFSVYTFTVPILFNGPGDVLIAVVNRTAGTDPGEYIAALDTTASQNRSYIGLYSSGNPADPPTFPADTFFGTIETATGGAYSGNWMIRGAGTTVAACDAISDIPWLSVALTSGTTAVGDTSAVDVVFDATGMSNGTYTGALCVDSNDSFTPRVTVPVTLTVSDPNRSVKIAPTTEMSGTAGSSVMYTLYVTNTGNIADIFDITVSGNSWPTTASVPNVALNVGESAMMTVTVDIPSSASNGAMDSATVTATSQNDAGATDSATLTTTAVVIERIIYMPVMYKN